MLGADAETLKAARASMRPPDEDIECFEDNAQSVEVFHRMRTQWSRSGMNGTPTGMRYEALPVVMGRCHVAEEDFDRVFDDVQIMEDEALKVAAEQ